MIGIIWLSVGVLLFFGVHCLPSLPRIRASLISRMGEGGYKGLFSLVAAAGLGMLIFGKAQAAYYHLYQVPAWGYQAPKILMLPASLLLMAPYFPNVLRAHLRHPMLLGIILWSSGHLLANGDLASVILFASFLGFSLTDMALINGRGPWQISRAHNVLGNLTLFAVSIAIYLAIWRFHGTLFGVSVP